STRWVLVLAVPALAVVILGVMGVRGGRSHADRDRQLASAPPGSDSTEASGRPLSATAQVRADMEADLAAGTLQRLLQARGAGGRQGFAGAGRGRSPVVGSGGANRAGRRAR